MKDKKVISKQRIADFRKEYLDSASNGSGSIIIYTIPESSNPTILRSDTEEFFKFVRGAKMIAEYNGKQGIHLVDTENYRLPESRIRN